MNPSLTLREGKWALVADTNDAQRPKAHSLAGVDMPFIKSSQPEKFLLYDLDAELPQKTDVANQHPEVFERLKARLKSLHTEVMEEGPNWEIPKSGKTGKTRVWNSY